MNCPNCGKPVIESDAFCRNCGTQLPKEQPVSASGFIGNEIPEPVTNSAPKREETWQEKYLTADGRLNRKPYILRSLFLGLISFVVSFVIVLLAGTASTEGVRIVLQLLFAVPGVMLVIRRLHDLGHSGWWCLLGLIPLVNLILGIYLLFFKGETGPNRFGPDLRYSSVYAVDTSEKE